MRNRNEKIILSITITLIIMLTVATITYALFIWNSDSNVKINSSVNSPTIIFDGGDSSISGAIGPTRTMEEGLSKTITTIASAPKTKINFYLKINDMPDELKEESFKYAFLKNDEIINEGDFSEDSIDYEIDDTTIIELISNEEVNKGEDTYILYLWIDGNMPNNNIMGNQSVYFDIYAEGINSTLDEIS